MTGPGTEAGPGPGSRAPRDHVRINVDRAPCEARLRCADVLYGTGGPRRAAALLRRYPGCLLASVRDAGGRCVTLSRSGRRFTATGVRSEREHALLVSVLHRWLAGLSCPPPPAAAPEGAPRRAD